MKTALLLLPVLVLTACGQAGALYLPGQGPKHAGKTTSSAPAPAPAAQPQDSDKDKKATGAPSP